MPSSVLTAAAYFRIGSSTQARGCAGTVLGWGFLFFRVAASIDSFDDAQIALGSVSERTEGFLIPGTVMCGDGLRDAVELNQDSALIEPILVGACW
jgi:hypothetical protein